MADELGWGDTGYNGPAAWFDWPWKLHRLKAPLLDRNHSIDPAAVESELYNLAWDPHETNNVLKDNPARAKSMLKELEAWQVSAVRSLNGKDY